jgi:hypothetical protein
MLHCRHTVMQCVCVVWQEVSVEDVEQLMEDTAEAKAYEDTIKQMLGTCAAIQPAPSAYEQHSCSWRQLALLGMVGAHGVHCRCGTAVCGGADCIGQQWVVAVGVLCAPAEAPPWPWWHL